MQPSPKWKLIGACTIILLSFTLIALFYKEYQFSQSNPPSKEEIKIQKSEELYNKIKYESQKRIRPFFYTANIHYPPKKITLIIFKNSGHIELWANTDATGPMTFIRNYSTGPLGGSLGPKLYKKDSQIPEGIYTFKNFEPETMYGPAIKIDFPNDFDIQKAKDDNRKIPHDIVLLHGKLVPLRGISLPPESLEELFTLVYDVGIQNASIIISPYDFRKYSMPIIYQPPWLPDLYKIIQNELLNYPLPNS